MAKKQLGAIDADLIERVDGVRGDVPRIRWVERAIEGALVAVENEGRAFDVPVTPRTTVRTQASPRMGKGYTPPIPKGG